MEKKIAITKLPISIFGPEVKLEPDEQESEYEITQSTIDMMFPDEESIEGFDLDDFFGLD